VRVIVVNSGSSSLKLSALDGGRLTGSEELTPGDWEGLEAALDRLGPVDAVGHRVVHGGYAFTDAVRVDPAVLAALWKLCDLAPLHQSRTLEAVEIVSRRRPDCPAVACFDTAFHSTIGPAAATYPLPRAWRERWGLRRFGFHGLSHAYAARRAAELLDRALEDLRIVTCHLGAGASLAAVSRGRSLDTTMGFTPLEGLAMATRAGSVDPGLLLWLMESTELTEPEIAHALEHESGMLGLAGDADMHAVIDRAATGDADARLGLDVYLHRLRSGIAAMAAAMGGLDVVAWTGGVGEHAPVIRARATAGLRFLGVEIDDAANQAANGDGVLSAPRATVHSVLVSAREDVEIARQVQRVLASGDPRRAV
jgi:acetate kinase